MKLLCMFGVILGCLTGGSVASAVNNQVLKDGVKEICEEYGGTYWESPDGTFGCDIGDLGVNILCVENAGCTVFDAAIGQPTGNHIKGDLIPLAQTQVYRRPQDYCRRVIRDHRPGKPAERAQRLTCRKFGLPVATGSN